MRYYLWQNFPPPNKELVIPLAKARFLHGQLQGKIAAREIAYLYKNNILRQYGQGRSVRYDLNLP